MILIITIIDDVITIILNINHNITHTQIILVAIVTTSFSWCVGGGGTGRLATRCRGGIPPGRQCTSMPAGPAVACSAS